MYIYIYIHIDIQIYIKESKPLAHMEPLPYGQKTNLWNKKKVY